MTGTVLAYHAVGTCSTDAHNLFVDESAFEAQMDYLKRKRHVVSLAELMSGAGKRSVAITFDDAYRSVYEKALPVLERFGFPATTFVPSAYIGRANGWDEPTGCPLDIMSEAELQGAVKRGLDVQSHGHDHIDMTNARREEVVGDLERSVEVLTGVVGQRPRYLAFPFSTASAEARDAARACGFEAAFSIDRPHEGLFAAARVQVTPRDDRFTFALKSSGYYVGLRHAAPLAAAYRVVKRARVLGVRR